MSKYQFKASIMCEECGEIHAEKWLTSANRHATTTTLWVLCDSCMENELRLSEEDDFDPFATELAPGGVHCTDCKCPFEPNHSEHHINYGNTKYCECLPF